MVDTIGSTIGAGNLGAVTVGGAAVASNIDTAGDQDWFAVTLTQGVYYVFNMAFTGAAPPAGLDPSLSLRDANGFGLGGNDDIVSNVNFNSRFSFLAGVTGTYYLDARSSSVTVGDPQATGGYTVSVAIDPGAPPTDDFGSQPGGFNLGAMTVGTPVNGNVQFIGDRDWFAITLTANQAYTFSQDGNGALDSHLFLRDTVGNSLAQNDDDSDPLTAIAAPDSLFNFTPSVTGTYYLDAGSFQNSDTGTYTISVVTNGAPPPPPVDDFDSSVGAPKLGTVLVGGTANGTINFGGDHDWFAVTLNAGSTYRITDTAGSLPDPRFTVRDSKGLALVGDDDSGGGVNSLLDFVPTTTGVYYIDANSPSAGVADIGTYTVGVSLIAPPTITSATYDAATGTLVVTGSDLPAAAGASNDIVASKFSFAGEGGSTYTLTTTANVEISSATAFTITLSATDKAGVNLIVNKNGTSSTGGTTYNLSAAEDWAAGANPAVIVADTTGNGITVANVPVPSITSATYNAATGVVTVSGSGFVVRNGATNDIVTSKFAFTGEGGATYALTDTANVEISSGTSFTIILSATDKAGVNLIVNKNGTSSTGGTTYNLAAAEDWANGAEAAVVIADTTGNGITAANVPVPSITSATYNAATGVLTVSGSGLATSSGASNDIVASKFTFTGEGGGTYALTDTANVEITSGTTFTITLSATDKTGVNLIVNKNGTSSTGGTTYNLSAAEDWAAGADAAVVIADTSGNGITATNVVTNTAPVLDASKTPSLGTINEDPGAPVGAVGTLVSELVESTSPAGGLDNVTDLDGPQIGIALTATDTANGSWFYSINGGTNWNPMGVVSDGAARFLLADASTRLYFQPAANFNGSIATAITFRAWDGSTGSNGGLGSTAANGGSTAFSTTTDTAGISVTAVNDAPVIGGLANVGYTEQAPAVTLAPTLTLADPDNANLTGATATLADPATGDALAVAGALPGGITLSGTSTASSIVLTGTASVADYQAALRQITFTNPTDDPTAKNTDNTRLVQFSATDGSATSALGNVSVLITAVNDLPTTNADSIAVAEGGTATVLVGGANNVLANDTDPDSTTLTAVLDTGPANGTLTLNANGTFSYTHNGSETTTDSFTYRANDGTGNGNLATVSITVTPVNDAPTVSLLKGSSAFIEDGAAIVVDAGLTVTDPDSANLTGATVTITNVQSGDALGFANMLGISGSYNAGSGVLTLSGTATAANYQAALRTITYSTPSQAPNTTARTISFVTSDGIASNVAVNKSVTVEAVNDAPVNTVPLTTQTVLNTSSLAFNAGNGNLISVSDSDAGNSVIQAIVSFTNGSLNYFGGSLLSGVNIVGTQSFLNSVFASLVFIPNAGYTGLASITITTDDGGQSGTGGTKTDTDTININVISNNAPVLDASKAPVLATILEDAIAPVGAVGTLVSALVDLAAPAGGLDNVTDADGPSLGIAITAVNGASGTLRYSTDGGTSWFTVGPVSNASALLLSAGTRLHFQPNPNFNGTINDVLTFRAWDGFTGTATSGATRQTADTATNGGATAFSSAIDTAAQTITAVNDPPSVGATTSTISEDTSGLPLLIASTTEPESLQSIIFTTLPGAGILTLAGNPVSAGQEVALGLLGGLLYTPAANAFGAPYTTFTYQVRDSGGTANGGIDVSAPAVATINVTPVADAPGVTSANTSEDTPTTSGLVISRNAVDGAEVTHFRITGISGGTLFQNDGVTAIANGDYITFAQGNAGLKFTPTANTFGAANFNVAGATSAAGAGLGTATAASITVNPVADTPAITNAATNEDTQTASGLVISRNAVDGAEVTHFKITGITGGTLFQADGTTAIANGSFITFAQANAGLKFTPALNSTANGTFNLQASISNSDAGLGGAVVPATITVAAVNDAPVNTAPAALATNEDTALAFTGLGAITIADVDASLGNFNVTLTVTNGTLNIGALSGASIIGGSNPSANIVLAGPASAINAALASLTYQPTANYTGPATLTVLTSDLGNSGAGGAKSDSDTIAITVNPVNDLPVAPATQSIAIDEDTASGPRAISASDADGDVLTYTVKSGSGPAKGQVSFDQAAGTFVYAPFANANGSDAFVIIVSDGKGGTTEQAVQVAVAPVNDAPFANPDAFSTVGGIPLALSAAQLLANDGDIEGGPLVVQAVAGPTGGTVSLVGTTITFTPTAGFSGVGGFDYQISDPQGGIAVARVTVTVGAGNRAPLVDGSQAVTTIENADRTFTVAASDPDGDPLTFSATTPLHGTVIGGTGGVFTYQPVTGYSGTDSFTVAVSDGKGGTAFQAITVNVIDVPEAAGFRLFTNAGWTGSVGGSGTVNGSNGHERVAIVNQAGTIAFDGSFTRGNDVIALPGNAAVWQVMRLSGSTALFSDGDTFVQLAVGTGTAIEFADGVRTLAFDAAGTMAIGAQAIGVNLAVITAAPTGTAPGGDDPDAFARLFLSNGTSASASGHLLVIGSNDAETLRLLGGEVQLDGSFNRGNDRLVFDFAAGTYEASRNGAQLHLTGHGLDLTTAAGTGLLLDFTDSDRLLAFSGSQMLIGTQAITSSPAFLIA